MIKSFVNVCKTHWKTLLAQWIIALGGGLLFCIMALFIINMGETTYAPLASIMTIFLFVIISLFIGMQYFSTYFDRALKMGETRNGYLIAIMIFFAVTTFVSLLAMNLVSIGEVALYEALFPGLECDPEFPILRPGIALSAVISLLLLMLSMVFGNVISSFGRVGFMTVYLLTCFSPMICSAIANRLPAFGMFVIDLFSFDVWYKPVLLAIPVILIIAVMFVLFKKHSVKV